MCCLYTFCDCKYTFKIEKRGINHNIKDNKLDHILLVIKKDKGMRLVS